ncbi:hypothetical protein K502DRAFT_351771 [Neoconidiobolus thromboides FSU 785]|nr:hypothetical protein K502DRAFT_351771 [Neoconidiobolus thromboides FSU 785]
MHHQADNDVPSPLASVLSSKLIEAVALNDKDQSNLKSNTNRELNEGYLLSVLDKNYNNPSLLNAPSVKKTINQENRQVTVGRTLSAKASNKVSDELEDKNVQGQAIDVSLRPKKQKLF